MFTDPKTKIEAHQALRSVEELAKTLGYRISQYDGINETGIFNISGGKGDISKLADAINKINGRISSLEKFLSCEYVNTAEHRKVE